MSTRTTEEPGRPRAPEQVTDATRNTQEPVVGQPRSVGAVVPTGGARPTVVVVNGGGGGGGEGREPSISDSEIAALAKRNAKQHKKWNRRLKVFFCCLGYKKNKDSITDVASIFAEFFSDLNAPSSDIAAGFVLLSKYQTAQRQWMLRHGEQAPHRPPGRSGPAAAAAIAAPIDQYLSGIPISQETKFLDISTAEDSHLVNDLIYYMNYSLAIFGWPLQVVDDPCMLCCIYPYLTLSPCCTKGSKGRRKVAPPKLEESKKDIKQEAEENMDKTSKKRDKKKMKKKKNQNKAAVGNSEDSSSSNAKTEQKTDKKELRDEHEQGGVRAAETESHARRVPGQLADDCDLPIILEDNCCGCNSASAERRLARHNYEIIYISYKSSINVVPFLVAADHSKRTIVVAIRGSMNLADMVTDLNGTVDRVPIANCPEDWLCHRGITSAAVYVKSVLLEKRILERAFNCRPDINSQDYGLVVCGHSLGAGAAAILGVLLREHYPSLRAFLYSPPGGILSMPVVEYTKQFAIGIILGNDTVARLGVAQLERLRYHSLLSLKSAQKSPGKILARALCPSMCCGANQVDYDPEHSLDLLHGTSGRAFDYNQTKIPFQVQPQVLYVPGRLIHVVKNYSFRSKTQRFWSGPIYQAVWTDNAIYDRVMISEGMFLDHLPNNLMHAMKMLFSRTLPGRRDSKLSPAPATACPVESPSVVGVAVTHSHGDKEEKEVKPKEAPKTTPDTLGAIERDREEEDRLARAKNVIEDDDNNNNNNSNNNNISSEDLNNNNNNEYSKLYPNLNRSRSSLADAIKTSSLGGSVSSMDQQRP